MSKVDQIHRYPQLQYQPHSPWSEGVKALFRQQLQGLRVNMVAKGGFGFAAESPAQLLDSSKLFMVAKDPHDGKLRAYTVPDASCQKEPNSRLPKHDSGLLRVADLSNGHPSVLGPQLQGILSAVHDERLRPQIPSMDQVAEQMYPRTHALVKQTAQVGKVMIPTAGALLLLSGLINNPHWTQATWVAIQNLMAIGAPLAVSGMGGTLLVNAAQDMAQNKEVKAPLRHHVDFYTLTGNQAKEFNGPIAPHTEPVFNIEPVYGTDLDI